VSVFNVFRYLTFRTAYAALTALLISLILGPVAIRLLRKWQVGQVIRQEGPKSHLGKAGTPTMGGVLILGAALVTTLLWANLAVAYVWLALLSTLAFGAIGFWDDYLKTSQK
jgi:phospho-N-acetylmuramoyl-pentapeptide-transferase